MKLRELHIKGFKSIDADAGQCIPLGDVTVLLGANGAGKSNVVSAFNMLQCLTRRELRQFVGKQGVSSLLFYGPKKTKAITIEALFDDGAENYYEIKLPFGHGDNLFIDSEKIYERIDFGQKQGIEQPAWHEEPGGELTLSDGYPVPQGENGESGLAQHDRGTSKLVYGFLSGIRIYQFHDTSEAARIEDRGYIDDAKELHHDADNLAAFLKILKEHASYGKYYKRIIQYIHRVMPQFGNFELEPLPGNQDYVRLNWRDSSGSDYLFSPHQISDGSLRFMALATLLLQPPELLPKFIVLDEPELGLHPAAIAELSSMVKIATQYTQVLLATQSTRLVDEFEPEELVIVERDEADHHSVFRKLLVEELQDWLANYSLSELWEKNVLGGQP